MPEFSQESKNKLRTCHPAIREAIEDAIGLIDFTVLYGHRTAEEQHRLFLEGKSRLDAGRGSKHEHFPSLAVDIAPYPVDWQDINRFRVLAGVVMGIAYTRGITLRWGGDWDRDWDEKDEKNLRDFGHFELMP